MYYTCLYLLPIKSYIQKYLPTKQLSLKTYNDFAFFQGKMLNLEKKLIV